MQHQGGQQRMSGVEVEKALCWIASGKIVIVDSIIVFPVRINIVWL